MSKASKIVPGDLLRYKDNYPTYDASIFNVYFVIAECEMPLGSSCDTYFLLLRSYDNKIVKRHADSIIKQMETV